MGASKRVNIGNYILSVLEDELSKDNRFLSAGEIAYRCNGELYKEKIKRKYPVTSSMIQNRMSAVRQLAITSNFIITTQRGKHLKNGGKSIQVVGWKIADEHDRDYVKIDQEIRQFIKEGQSKSMMAIFNIAKKQGLIKPEDIIGLEE